MAESILSPLSIWKDFNIPTTLTGVVVSEQKKDGVTIQNLFIDGNKSKSGQVKILITIVKQDTVKKAPAILMLKELEGSDVLTSLIALAKEGFVACTVDIEGKKDNCEYFTFYPKDMMFAEYYIAKDNLSKLKDDIKCSCFYEWACVIKYAIAFLAGIDNVGKIGVIGGGDIASAVWQAVANNKMVSSFVSVYNGGWKSYKGHYKFGENENVQYSDEVLAYIAGVEPQSYAQHISCPTFIVSNPCDIEFEGDRAHDTLKRVKNDKKGILYESKCARGLSIDSIDTIRYFLFSTLLSNRTSNLALEPEISSEIIEGKIIVKISPTKKGLKDISLFVAEEQIETIKRSYYIIKQFKQKDDEYIFEYVPYQNSKRAFVYATVYYENNFAISTNIESIEFPKDSAFSGAISPIIYSGRNDGNEGLFLSQNPVEFADIFVSNKDLLRVKEGAQSIKGLSILGGVISHSICSVKYKPKEDSIIIFDLFAKEDCKVVLSVYTDYFGNRVEYFYPIDILAGRAWQNYKIELNKFKTADGMVKKDMNNLTSISFYSGKEVLMNNLLWI